MQLDDFFTEPDEVDPLGMPGALRLDLLSALRRAPLTVTDDLGAALALTRLVRTELEAYGTDGGQRLTDTEIELAQRSLRATLERLRIDLNLPWRDFSGFRVYWNSHDGYGSWQARRNILAGLFNPIIDELNRREDARFRGPLATPVSPHTSLGWPHVDVEIRELKRLFQAAATTQDYRDVGNRCVGVLEAISRTVYQADRHLRPGESEPPVPRTDQRIGRYVKDSLGGAEHEEVRGVAKKVAALAHKVKHRPTATRRDAGIAADAVILLANVLRRVDEES